MKQLHFAFGFLLTISLLAGSARAEGRAGTVEWSDGRKVAGAISLTPGKDLRLFTGDTQVVLSLDEVNAIRFKPEKQEMWEGFYFPNAGQAKQVKTGEVYPIRYLQTEITLANGKVLAGHLMTTTVYLETNDTTQKIVLMAKQTGANGQKLTDLIYPTVIRFDATAASAGFSQIDLTQAGFVPLHQPVVVTQPDLASSPLDATTGKAIWTVPMADPGKIIFAVEASDGIHVTWPLGPIPGPEIDPDIQKAMQIGLALMQDFYDTRTLLGCFVGVDGTDIYSLVMMKRTGTTNGFNANKIPWSLVILHWKYDAEQKKATLLNRALLVQGRAEGSPLPTVFKQPELLRDISVRK